jgi:polysaccharide biosynthesis/export protein
MTSTTQRMPDRFRRLIGAGSLAAAGLAGCGTPPQWVATSGPSREQVTAAASQAPTAVRLIDVSDAVARRLAALPEPALFSQQWAGAPVAVHGVGPGDALEVSVWEAPPALLFGTGTLDSRAVARSGAATFPEQTVSAEGTIDVPFAGTIPVAGKSPQQIGADIARRLEGRANRPQVLVRVTRNASANVTVVGEVTQSVRMPLTAKGERLLDAIASAGGARQPVGKVTVQVTRGERVLALPLERVIQSPRENVALAAGDVVTVLFQPLSFTALGATGQNAEIGFEAQGISLAQALARAGGVQDARSDARGVFVFRFEDARAVTDEQRAGPTTADGKVPVVYRVDLTDPAAFLVAQSFPVRNRDVVYVANAPSAELQKFLNILTASIFSVQGLSNLGR